MKIVLIVALAAWTGGGKAEARKDISQHQNVLHEKPTPLLHKSEGLSNRVHSEVINARKSRKMQTGFFSSSMTKPLLSAMKSTLRLFQNPFARKRKVSKKSPTKTTERSKTATQNISRRHEIKRQMPPKRVPTKPNQSASLTSKYPPQKSVPTQTKPLKQKPLHQKHSLVRLSKSKARKPNDKNEVKIYRPLKQKVGTKQTRKPQKVKSSNLRKHQQLISNFFRKPQKVQPNNIGNPQILHKKPTFRNKSKHVQQKQQLNSNTIRKPQHEKLNIERYQNEKGSTNIRKPQVLSNGPILSSTSKRDQHLFEKPTIKRKVQTEEKKVFFPTNIKPIQPFNVKETNKTDVKQLIVELHDQIHHVLKHQNIPEQKKSFQTLPPVINIENANFGSSDGKIRKPDVHPSVQNSNNNHAKKQFKSAKLEDAFKDIKQFMKKNREIPNTQTSFGNDQKTMSNQVPIKPTKFKPFIPRFKTIENQSPVHNDITSDINAKITASTEEQELSKNGNKASVKTPVQANDNPFQFDNFFPTESPKKPSVSQVAEKRQFEEAVSSDIHKSKVKVKTGDIHNNALNKAFNRDFDAVPSSMDDCDHLVSDCYEKLLDRKIIELQDQMQMLELKYWGNRV